MLAQSYEREILPLLDTPCLDCHDSATKKGELDLERFADLAAVRTDPATWQEIIFQLETGEMPPVKKNRKPPKDVPQLPDIPPAGLTERELIQRHSTDPACAKCHARIDPYGFALEAFDPIGRLRSTPALALDTTATLPDGTTIDGLPGIRHYLLTTRRDTFVRHFCKKLLGYALGRAVQLSDEPFLDDLITSLPQDNFSISVAIEAIVQSPGFRNIRPNQRNTPNHSQP